MLGPANSGVDDVELGVVGPSSAAVASLPAAAQRPNRNETQRGNFFGRNDDEHERLLTSGHFYGGGDSRPGRRDGGFQPVVILLQIAVLQSFYYAALAGIGVGLNGLLWLISPSASATDYVIKVGDFFSAETYSLQTPKGVAILFAIFVITVVPLPAVVALVVERSKKCADFCITVKILHILICCFVSSLPSRFLFWIAETVSATLCTLMSEARCRKQELREIVIKKKKKEISSPSTPPSVTSAAAAAQTAVFDSSDARSNAPFQGVVVVVGGAAAQAAPQTTTTTEIGNRHAQFTAAGAGVLQAATDGRTAPAVAPAISYAASAGLARASAAPVPSPAASEGATDTLLNSNNPQALQSAVPFLSRQQQQPQRTLSTSMVSASVGASASNVLCAPLTAFTAPPSASSSPHSSFSLSATTGAAPSVLLSPPFSVSHGTLSSHMGTSTAPTAAAVAGSGRARRNSQQQQQQQQSGAADGELRTGGRGAAGSRERTGRGTASFSSSRRPSPVVLLTPPPPAAAAASSGHVNTPPL